MNDDPPGKVVFTRRFVLGDRGQIARMQRLVVGALKRQQYDSASRFAIRLALGEALANAFTHGNRDDPTKAVRLECRIDSSTVVLDVEDAGEGFEPRAVPDPAEPENLGIPCGRGIVLMRAYMTEVTFHPPGNRVRMMYRKRRD